MQLQSNENFGEILAAQRRYFATGATLPIQFRIEQLTKLKEIIQKHENEIANALYLDLHKAKTEAICNEVLLVTEEISFIIKNLKKWARPQKVKTPFPALWPGRSEIHFQPYGTVLIIGPWNYPFLLILSPLIGAISAGNCAIIKPSELAIHTQNLLVDIITQNFPPHYLAAITADPAKTARLLEHQFDYIFYTGGTHVGKIVMEAAAKHLTPMTLELGGKSPCIVDKSADLDYAARRITWAKTTNAGQVCLAPDYLYVENSIKNKLISKIEYYLTQFYGNDAKQSSSFGRIINQKHFERLIKLLQKGNILFGGQTHADHLYIAPTLIDAISWQDPIMKEEIFGPLLPILTFNNINDVIQAIKPHPKPLALYLFSRNENTQQKVVAELSFGGGCINDCIFHLLNYHLPFGGVGDSGIGQYHGRYSFETFSHRKSIYQKHLSFDLSLQYPPYSEKKLWWLRRLIKL